MFEIDRGADMYTRYIDHASVVAGGIDIDSMMLFPVSMERDPCLFTSLIILWKQRVGDGACELIPTWGILTFRDSRIGSHQPSLSFWNHR